MIVPDDGQNQSAAIKSHYNPVLMRAAAKLGYADTILLVQSIEEWPRDNFCDGRFAALSMKVAYETERKSSYEISKCGLDGELQDMSLIQIFGTGRGFAGIRVEN